MIYLIISLFTLTSILILGYRYYSRKVDYCHCCFKRIKNVVKVDDDLFLCQRHLDLHQKSKMKEFFSTACDENREENGIFLNNINKQLNDHDILSYIKSSYDLKKDKIITYQTLYVDDNKKEHINVLLK